MNHTLSKEGVETVFSDSSRTKKNCSMNFFCQTQIWKNIECYGVTEFEKNIYYLAKSFWAHFGSSSWWAVLFWLEPKMAHFSFEPKFINEPTRGSTHPYFKHPSLTDPFRKIDWPFIAKKSPVQQKNLTFFLNFVNI